MILEQCKGVHCVDLGESFLTSIYLQKSASIQPRTSPSKFGGKLFNIIHSCPYSPRLAKDSPPKVCEPTCPPASSISPHPNLVNSYGNGCGCPADSPPSSDTRGPIGTGRTCEHRDTTFSQGLTRFQTDSNVMNCHH